MRYKDKIVLITGSGSGIGKAAAIAFSKEGGELVVSDINEVNGLAKNIKNPVVIKAQIHAGGRGKSYPRYLWSAPVEHYSQIRITGATESNKQAQTF